MRRNRIETERRNENVHDFDFIFFSVSVAEFQQTRQVILIKSAHAQPRALYKPSNHESQWWTVQRDNCAIFLQAQYYWLQIFVGQYPERL